ncbi:MAG: glucose-1-phosphate adenylyltransferase [Actinobacteria bacterium]|nr:glucose-1-phosphate adenylyltransferase [Actinomycetota bacterium]
MAADPKVLVIVLAGGEGKRLLPLTDDRAKPAVPFGGAYRLIDFALSNFANARYLKIVVLTQYKSHSLDRHISQTWRVSTLLGNYVTPVPAQMRRGPHWFAGSADAIYQNLNLIADEQPDLVCVFGADHIYRMDPRQMVEEHLATGAGVTVAAIPVPRRDATAFGVIEADAEGRISAFHEKSAEPPTMPGDPTRCLASMGNYVFDTDTLCEIVTPRPDRPSMADLGSHVVPALTERGVARVYDFSHNLVPGQEPRERGYWRDVGTIDAYFDANMDLIAPVPVFNLYNDAWPVFTDHRPLPPAKISRGAAGEAANIEDSLLGQGCIVSGAEVLRSIVSPTAYVDHGAKLAEAIVFPGVHVGAGAVLRRCIVDKNVKIPPGVRIGVEPEEDLARFPVSASGVVVVPKGYDFSTLDGPTVAAH